MSNTSTTFAPEPASAVIRPRVRYIGVDLARFTAIIGMMAAHLVGLQEMLPNVPDAELAVAEATGLVTNGTAAALFAVLGGLSIVFATRRLLRENRIGAAVGAVALRGAVLIVIGLLLGFFENSIVVVLAYYGLAMIIVAPCVALRGWILASIASVLGLFGGILNEKARFALGVHTEGPHISFEMLSTDPLATLRALLLTGEYPVITWTVYLLVGILVGRAFVAATARGTLGRTAATFAAAGAAVMLAAQLVSNFVLANLSDFGIRSANGVSQQQVAEFIMTSNYGAPAGQPLWLHVIAVPHSGSIGDLVRTIGLSLAVIGLLVFLFDREGVAGRTPGRLLDTLRAAGAAPLTIYALHIIVSALLMGPYLMHPELWETAAAPWWAIGGVAFALQLAGVLAIGAILSATGRRGPLETVLSKIVGAVIR